MSSKIVKNADGKEARDKMKKTKHKNPYRRRRYKDGTIVIYSKSAGAICQCTDEANAQLVLNSLNQFYHGSM